MVRSNQGIARGATFVPPHATSVFSNFSAIYGTKKEEVRSLVGDRQASILTLQHLQNYPALAKYIPGLRKAKAKGMVTALIEGSFEQDNHFISYASGVYNFYYRGTCIYSWNAFEDKGKEIPAGLYEGTPSTRNQRKEIQKSIQNFRESVFSL